MFPYIIFSYKDKRGQDRDFTLRPEDYANLEPGRTSGMGYDKLCRVMMKTTTGAVVAFGGRRDIRCKVASSVLTTIESDIRFFAQNLFTFS